MREVCVVVPVYKEKLSVSEEEAVDRTVRVLHSRDIFFVTPDSMDSSYYKERYPTAEVETFHQKYFSVPRIFDAPIVML